MALDQLDSPGGYQFFLLGEQGAFLAIKMLPVPFDHKVWLKSLSFKYILFLLLLLPLLIAYCKGHQVGHILGVFGGLRTPDQLV